MGRVINDLRETKTDFIYLGFTKWGPLPVKSSQFQDPDLVRWNEGGGNTYEHIENAINRIKAALPRVIFCAALEPQVIGYKTGRCEWNPKTGEHIEQAELWKMAIDPRKWGINVLKERFQYDFARWHQWVPQNLAPDLYDWRTADAFFPDITNPRYQELLLSWAQGLIDAGADAIWFDFLFWQAGRLRQITNDDNHPAVKESHEAACKIVDEVHKYGRLKGKHIYVGSWPEFHFFRGWLEQCNYPPPDYDFVTPILKKTEVKEMKFDETEWDKELMAIRKRWGNVPVLVSVDAGPTTDQPLGILSQKLSREEQIKFLKVADDFFDRKGVIFIYPIYGNHMGNDATILSYGNSKIFDSKAPEFQLYDTLKELAQSKKQR